MDVPLVLVPKEVLLHSPSSEDGVSAVKERRLRIYAVEMIQRATELLRLPQICSVSAAAILQRFYFRRSLADFDVRIVAPTCLLLACKLEEHHCRLRDIVLVFHRLEMRNVVKHGVKAYVGCPTPALDSAGREIMKKEIIRVERLILRELGYVVWMLLEHPHKYVIQFVKSMVRSPNDRAKELAQKAWSYLNDSTRTVLCCMYSPHQITTASIYLAARDLKIKLPLEPPWWVLFDTELHDIQSIARTILSLYKQPPSRYIQVEAKRDPFLLGLSLATPLSMDSAAPLKSPMSDEDVQGSPPHVDASLDSDRINEMANEVDIGQSVVPQALSAAAKKLPGSFSAVESGRQRSRSPKRKVVQLKLAARPGASSKSKGL